MTAQSDPAIITITLNPALDFSTSVPRILPDEKLYCSPPRIDPGGGGVNVVRAIGKLGGQATAFVVAGGATGERLMSLLADEGVQTRRFAVTGETRFSFAVLDDHTGQQQRFSLPGEALAPQEASALLATIEDAVPQDAYVVLSGGMALGLPDDFPQQIQARIAAKTKRFIVDTSKAPLARLVGAPIAPVHLLRIDHKEAERAAARLLTSLEDSLTFAASLVARGAAETVVTGRGAEGSLLVSEGNRFLCRPPRVPVRSKIGAGDSFVGAMVLALSRGDKPDQALRWGVAAASATVGTEGTALCEGDTVRALFEKCIVERV